MCCWSDLHNNLLLSIFERLPLVDVLRAKAVCSSWYSVVKDRLSIFFSEKHDPPLQAPWLLLPPKDEKDIDSCCFFNLEEKRVYNFKNMPKGFSNSRCIGSSHGWLILLDDRANPYLLNPFTRQRIQLPSIDTFGFGKEGEVVKRNDGKEYEVRIISRPHSVFKSAGELRETFILKAICWTDKKEDDFGVVVIYDVKRIALCRPGDKRWMDLGSKCRIYCDIMYQDNQLYVISFTWGVEIWELQSSVFKKIMDIEPSIPRDIKDIIKSIRYYRGVKSYSVKSNGDLLMFIRLLNTDQNDMDDDVEHRRLDKTYRTCLFVVYKMDFDRKKWLQVKSLGNRVVFLGGNHSMSLSAGDLPECEENLIYFTDDRWCDMKESLLYGGHDMGIFNLEDGRSIKPIYQSGLRRILPPPFWVVPNLANP